MEPARLLRPHPTDVTLKVSFDETTGVIKVGYSTTINLASSLTD